jgi:hypothetical protein
MPPSRTPKVDKRRVIGELAFPATVTIRHPRIRPTIRKVSEALRLIEHDLPIELRKLPRWEFAQALLKHVTQTGKKKDLTNAFRQLRQALSDEGWLVT